MSEFLSRQAESNTHVPEYDQYESGVVIDMDSQSNDSPIDLGVHYIDSEGEPGAFEHTIDRTCFKLIGELTVPPEKLPDIEDDERAVLGDKEYAKRVMAIEKNRNAIYNAENLIAAKYYVRGLFGGKVNALDADTAERVVNELVSVAVSYKEAVTQIEE